MSAQSFRFLHAGNFHLERVLSGIHEAPEHLLDMLVNAPYLAAEHVFQAAVREEVDFVVLAGDVLDPTRAGPRAVGFLRQQFNRLKERGIAVYWSASEADLAEDCIRTIDWPANVRIFGSEKVEQLTHYRGEHSVADILGRSWSPQKPLRAAEFLSLAVGGYQIAAMHCRGDVHNEPRQGIEYWAVGGSRTPDTPFSGVVTAHSCGSPQGFAPDETGPYGCTLVHVGSDRQTRMRMIETDAIRWYHEQIQVPSGNSRGEVQNELRGRLRTLQELDRPALVNWKLAGIGRFDSVFARGQQRADLLEWMRRDFGYGSPPIWSLGLQLDPPHALRADWCDEDSIFGDYMRVVQQYQEHDEQPLDLRCVVGSQVLPLSVGGDDWLNDPLERDLALREAALWGLDLLRGDDGLPHEHALAASRSQSERKTA